MSLRVLEWIRHRDGIWNLPASQLEELSGRFPDVRFESPPTREEADALLPEADVVLGFAVRRENFASARRLRWIHTTAAGVEWMLFPELVESEVVLTSSRGLHADAMAEHALAVMLAFTRRLHEARDAQRERRWTQLELARAGFGELRGSTVGIVGFGHIGRAIGATCRALGMHVLAVRRHPEADPAPAHEQCGPEGLHELLRRSDWVVLAAPHTRESEKLIGEAELAVLKPGARLINVGRGALVDEPALVRALAAGRIAGAGLDVCTEEPLPEASPLWAMPQVILTPHVSGLAPRYWERASEIFARNLRAYVAGSPLENVVDKRAGY
jgi:phosphoglycerate dehydrogenase-like enzyme